jgi:hypothetical protein
MLCTPSLFLEPALYLGCIVLQLEERNLFCPCKFTPEPEGVPTPHLVGFYARCFGRARTSSGTTQLPLPHIDECRAVLIFGSAVSWSRHPSSPSSVSSFEVRVACRSDFRSSFLANDLCLELLSLTSPPFSFLVLLEWRGDIKTKERRDYNCDAFTFSLWASRKGAPPDSAVGELLVALLKWIGRGLKSGFVSSQGLRNEFARFAPLLRVLGERVTNLWI